MKSDGAGAGLGEAALAQSDAPEGFDEDIGEGGEPEAELVCTHRPGRGPIGEEIELLFFDSILHIAACAVEPLVEGAGPDPTGLDRGHDEARIVAPGQYLGLGDDPALAAPALAGAIAEVPEAPPRARRCRWPWSARRRRSGRYGSLSADGP